MAQTVLNETQIPDVVTDSTIYGTGKTGDALGVSGTSLPFNFVTGSIAFADSAGFLIEDNKHLRYNSTLRSVRMGKDVPFNNFADLFPFFATAEFDGESIVNGVYAYGTGTSGLPLPGFGAYRSRGTVELPTPVQKNDVLGSFYGTGYDGADFYNGGRIRFYADGNWVTGTYRPSRTAFLVTPSGTTSQIEKMVLYGDSLNLINTGTYNVDGVPHTHTGAPVFYTNTENIFRCPTPGGNSAFTALISSVGATTIVYKAPITGTENALVVSSTGQLAKMRLYNTTRGNYALISQTVVATKTITFTSSVPVDWAANDVIVITSQTVSGGGIAWVDLEITNADLLGRSGLAGEATVRSATVGDYIGIHPFETYSSSKEQLTTAQVANISHAAWFEIKLNSNLFSVAWGASSHTAIIWKVLKYYL